MFAGPSFATPFFVSYGKDGLRFWLFVAGDWTTAGSLDQYYGLFVIPVTLRHE